MPVALDLTQLLCFYATVQRAARYYDGASAGILLLKVTCAVAFAARASSIAASAAASIVPPKNAASAHSRARLVLSVGVHSSRARVSVKPNRALTMRSHASARLSNRRLGCHRSEKTQHQIHYAARGVRMRSISSAECFATALALCESHSQY